MHHDRGEPAREAEVVLGRAGDPHRTSARELARQVDNLVLIVGGRAVRQGSYLDLDLKTDVAGVQV